MGDFSANFCRGDAGIRTVEGTVAGHRAAGLEQQRHSDQRDFEARKRQIALEKNSHGSAGANSAARPDAIGLKFKGATSAAAKNATLAEATVGLVTADEFRALHQQQQQNNQKKKKKRNGTDHPDDDDDEDETAIRLLAATAERKRAKKERKQRLLDQKVRNATLSFAGDDDDDKEHDVDLVYTNRGSAAGNLDSEENLTAKTKMNNTNTCTGSRSIIKDPTVDTSFLPDKARDAALQAERVRLRDEWRRNQASAKRERLEIVYSYWDGSGHRRSVTVEKGDTIETFLECVRKDLAAAEFRELGNISSDALLYVKEDLILPHDLTFYDLIVSKARGKSGPLFHFDVHEDVRTGALDVRIEKDESHPGKIVQRHWYERNKHIFPASRWEIYDPTKEYGTYTIGGK